MAIGSLLLIPVALYMTDFSQPINVGLKGPYLAATIQILNAFASLCLVYAFRFGQVNYNCTYDDSIVTCAHGDYVRDDYAFIPIL